MKFLKLKKIREKLKEKWDDFIYLNINIPKWNILFLKRNSRLCVVRPSGRTDVGKKITELTHLLW